MDNARDALRSVKYNDERHAFLGNGWNIRDVSSLCCISRVGMSGWQFFPGK
jgi:hypothetical protein